MKKMILWIVVLMLFVGGYQSLIARAGERDKDYIYHPDSDEYRLLRYTKLLIYYIHPSRDTTEPYSEEQVIQHAEYSVNLRDAYYVWWKGLLVSPLARLTNADFVFIEPEQFPEYLDPQGGLIKDLRVYGELFDFYGEVVLTLEMDDVYVFC